MSSSPLDRVSDNKLCVVGTLSCLVVMSSSCKSWFLLWEIASALNLLEEMLPFLCKFSAVVLSMHS